MHVCVLLIFVCRYFRSTKFQDFVAHCLAKDPKDRLATVELLKV